MKTVGKINRRNDSVGESFKQTHRKCLLPIIVSCHRKNFATKPAQVMCENCLSVPIDFQCFVCILFFLFFFVSVVVIVNFCFAIQCAYSIQSITICHALICCYDIYHRQKLLSFADERARLTLVTNYPNASAKRRSQSGIDRFLKKSITVDGSSGMAFGIILWHFND